MGAVRLEMASKPLLGGRAFGAVGAYEELTGAAFFAVDPLHPLNRAVTDLELAPRGADGCVEFSADVRILRPVDGRRGNGGIFLDVVNRGSSIFVRMTEPGPMGPGTQLSAGWLLQRGYTVVSCGWQHDVPRGGGRFGLTAPSALIGGRPLTGRVTTAKQIDTPATVMGPFDGSAPESSYPPLDTGQRDATLTVRDDPSGPAELIPRERWRFVDPHSIAVAEGFELGKTYELSYSAVGAPITGIGFLALRDLVAYLRRAPEWVGQIDFALAMGASQTGRLLRQMLHQGFCADEQGQLVLDGILAIAAGARMTEANWRFGQPSAQGPKSAVFPFTDATQTDPVSGQTDGLLRRALQRGTVPRVIHLNTSSEYCSSAAITHVSAALSHLTADGQADVDVPANVRIYHCASTQHAASPLPLGPSDVPTGRGVYFPNTIDYKPFVRAAVDNLYAWVVQGTEPPPSQYPRIDEGTLVDGEVVRGRLPGLPGPGLPRRARLPDLLPAVNADGNEVAGLRHPDLVVPLATYTGWNPRHPQTGGAHLLARATGSTIPFPRTREERTARDDPRPSIAERYASRDVYLERVRSAAMQLVEQRYLSVSEVDDIVEASKQRYEEFMRLESPTP
jgi:alpha/beta hydrolase family protein